MNIALLYPLPAPGQELRPDDADTLAQAEAVAEALRGLGHGVRSVDFTLDLAQAARDLASRPTDLVFNLVETVAGSARLLHLAPALLAALGLPCTGSGAAAILLSTDKLLCKRTLAPLRLPFPAWASLETLGQGAFPGPGRYILKSVAEHASQGLGQDSVIQAGGPSDLEAALRAKRERDNGEWFAESYVEGREFNLALLDAPDGPQVLPLAEMRFHDWDPERPTVVDYAAKWDEGSADYHNTRRGFDFSPEDAPLLAELARVGRETWRAFGLAGYARVDFRVDRAGRPLVIDVNANPCLSPDAGFAAALAQAGIPFPAALSRILDRALAGAAAR
jgi:D-alanine-D-alanine ligase